MGDIRFKDFDRSTQSTIRRYFGKIAKRLSKVDVIVEKIEDGEFFVRGLITLGVSALSDLGAGTWHIIALTPQVAGLSASVSAALMKKTGGVNFTRLDFGSLNDVFLEEYEKI